MYGRFAKVFATLLTVSLGCAASGRAAMIYVGDVAGNVGRYNTVTGQTSSVGSIAPFNPSQALGLAYDAGSSSILILDRSANRVYSMNATTGVSSLLFNSSSQFQGGAISGGLLYGIQEITQMVAAYNLAGGQVVLGPALAGHAHAMGVDAATGQLYVMGNDNPTIKKVNTNGTIGATVLTATGLPSSADDMDYFGGDFLATQYTERQIWRINGVTGASALYLTSSQLSAMGVNGSVSGVVVVNDAGVVPEPASLAMMGLGLLGLAGAAVGRSRTRTA